MKNNLRSITRLNFVVLCFGLFALGSCKKETQIDNLNLDKISKNDNALMMSTMGFGIPSFPLDWENLSYMPAPAGTTPIPMPWQSGLGGRKIDDDIVFDYKKVDGWELVYNTFNTSVVYNPSYFMLYNKFRGLLRTYFYFTTASSYPSSNLTYLLTLRGANAQSSPMLNFSGNDIVTIGNNSVDVSQIQPYLVSNTGSWYATEFEIAYDQQITSTNYQSLQLNWSINPNSISQITLNGKETGTISGTIEQKKAGTNFFEGLANNLIDAGLKIGSKEASEGIRFVKNDAIKSAILDATTNGIGGIVKGFLSGILGGGGSTPTKQQVNLKINSKIDITGQAVVQSQLYDNVFTLPGTLNSENSVPFYPNYNKAMGVFYVSSKPVVKIKRTPFNLYQPPTFEGGRTRFNFSIDDNSYQILFNPVVLADATISNIKKEIILIKHYLPDDLERQSSILSEENVGGVEMYVVESLTLVGLIPTSSLNSNLAVRISFDVVPKNGAQKITIVKTFKATGQQI